MNDSRQLTILKLLTAQIELVTPGNGYDFDLTAKVFRGRMVFGADTDPPFVSILESPRPVPATDIGDPKLVRQNDWQLLVQGWAADDKEHPLDAAYGLKASVEQALSQLVDIDTSGRPVHPAIFLLGRRAISLTIGPGVCRPPTEATSLGFFFLPLTVVYSEDLRRPFEL
jgi:hypothetical protein